MRHASLVLLLLLVLSGCALLRGIAALQQVRFDLDRVDSVHLAGVDLTRIQRYEDLGVMDAMRLGNALLSGHLPLDAVLHVGAENPEGNPEARLLALEWTLFLEDRETVSGAMERETTLPSGARTVVPVSASLDLLEFFEGSSRELVNLVLALTGPGGEPVGVRLEAHPTVQTPLGPIRYPRPVVMGGEVGGR